MVSMIRTIGLTLCGVVLMALLMQSRILAQAGDDGSLQIVADASGSDSWYLPGAATVVQFILLLAFVSMGLWAAWVHSPLHQVARLGGPKAQDLFLKVPLRKLNAALQEPTLEGYLRTVDTHNAIIVVPIRLKRGDRLVLDVGKLPDYPEERACVQGHVISSRTIGREPATYIVKVRFEPLEAQSKQVLTKYLLGLTRQSQFDGA